MFVQSETQVIYGIAKLYVVTSLPPLPPFGIETFLRVIFTFATGPWAIITLVVEITASIWYFSAVKTLKDKGRNWPFARSILWVFAMLACSVAFQSGVPLYAVHIFTVHIVQHLDLMIAVPIMLAMSAPVTLFMQTAPYSAKIKALKFLKSKGFRKLTNPIITVLANNGIMFWFFLGHGIVIAMNHAVFMDFINIVFLLFGMLAWWPVVSPDFIGKKRYSHPLRVLLAASGMPFDAFLAIALLPGGATSSIAPTMYTLQSIQTGAAVFWITIMFMSGIGALVPLVGWLSLEKRETTRDEDRFETKHTLKSTSKLGWWQDQTEIDKDGLITVPWATDNQKEAP